MENVNLQVVNSSKNSFGVHEGNKSGGYNNNTPSKKMFMCCYLFDLTSFYLSACVHFILVPNYSSLQER